MFENLTDRLANTFKLLAGQKKFTEENMQPALREVRISLLEADVALSVVKEFVERVKEKALGEQVSTYLKPEQDLIKIVNDELVHILGDTRVEIDLKTQPPAVILLAGLQGSGKTTSAAKLAHHLKTTANKKVLLVSADVYRPAAIEQLKKLSEQIDVAFFESHASEKPVDIVNKALDRAKKQFIDVVIVDTAGRLHVDTDMMNEIKALHKAVKPVETLFVVDSMTGQDAANTAKAFHDALSLTGVILSKVDGDARGGAALSVKSITGQPIKFIGTGEKITSFEAFYPERIASRILGMGDILSLIEEVERKADKQTSEKLAKKFKKGKNFDFEDFRQQLEQMSNMGGVSSMLSKLPGMGQFAQQAASQINDKEMIITISIINSMTAEERRNPKLLERESRRKHRIAKGSGRTIQTVNGLIKKFKKMSEMMKKMNKPGGIKQMMRGIGGMAGVQNFLPNADKNK